MRCLFQISLYGNWLFNIDVQSYSQLMLSISPVKKCTPYTSERLAIKDIVYTVQYPISHLLSLRSTRHKGTSLDKYFYFLGWFYLVLRYTLQLWPFSTFCMKPRETGNLSHTRKSVVSTTEVSTPWRSTGLVKTML